MRAPPSKSVSIEKGRGTPLREIPNVAHKLSKRKADDNLMLLHTILFGKKAKAQMVKRNIGQFSGFAWSEKEEEKQRARIKEKIDKCVKEKLIVFCDVLDIPISRSNVKKEELAVKVLEFLESPKETRDVIIADQEKAKKRKSTPKRGKSGESSDTPAKRKRQTKKRDLPSDTEEGKDEGDADSEGTNDPHEEDDAAPEEESDHEKTDTDDEKDEVEVEKPSKKKSSSKKTVEESSGSKGKDKQPSAKGSARSGEKSSKQIAKSTSSPAKKQKVDHVESSKEKSKKQPSKPQAKGSKEKGKATKKGKAKAEPTRKEMLEVVSKILKEVDFNTVRWFDFPKSKYNVMV
jgi:omega-hydroxypalmitate O-feruloyl transferase/protein DEK